MYQYASYKYVCSKCKSHYQTETIKKDYFGNIIERIMTCDRCGHSSIVEKVSYTNQYDNNDFTHDYTCYSEDGYIIYF